MQKLKVVATTRVWQANGVSKDFPMWQPVGSNEYIIGYTEEEPTLSMIGRFVDQFQHTLEGKVTEHVVEVFSGYEVYLAEALTHNEHFQLKYGDEIDFPATDVTKISSTKLEDLGKG